MIGRSDEVIKQLNRLVNDRTLAPNVRSKIREAMRHIREMELKLIDSMRDK